MADTKRCTKCGETKSLTEFSVAKNGKATGDKLIIKPACKACQSRVARAWAKANVERATLNRFIFNLRTRYGMTLEQYLVMLAAQDQKCAICRTEEETKLGPYGTVQRMSVDHCHATGRVRGLLCNRCNRALGLLGDDTDLLRAAIGYLEGK